jgi:hypothetical protein
LRVGKGLLAAALVAGPIRCPRASHGGGYGLHGLWRTFAKLAFGGRDRAACCISWLNSPYDEFGTTSQVVIEM